MALIRSLFFLLFLVFCAFIWGFSSEAMAELERLRAVMYAFLNFLGVTPGAQEKRLWDMCRHVLDAIDSGVRRGARVAQAMVEVSVEVDLIEVSGFPTGEELRYHEDLVACYGPAREAVAAQVPTTQVLARLPPH
jgi:hypothetical protein